MIWFKISQGRPYESSGTCLSGRGTAFLARQSNDRLMAEDVAGRAFRAISLHNKRIGRAGGGCRHRQSNHNPGPLVEFAPGQNDERVQVLHSRPTWGLQSIHIMSRRSGHQDVRLATRESLGR